jgi:hypothetical protein
MNSGKGDGLNVGSLHASAFKGQDPSAMALGELRKLIGKMYVQLHRTKCLKNDKANGNLLLGPAILKLMLFAPRTALLQVMNSP